MKTNVLFVLSDSLRADFLGCYGDEKTKSPNIDLLAKRGVSFSRAYAENPVTIPSRTAMVSSCYTFTHRPWMPLLDTDLHVAEIMKKNGYETAAFSNSPFDIKSNMDRGFDTFKEYTQKNSSISPKHYDFPDLKRVDPNLQEWMESYTAHIERRLYALERGDLPSDSPELLTTEAIRWLKKDTGRNPFFLWLDYFDPHEPWSPPPPYDDMYDPSYEGRLFPRPRYMCDYLAEPELNHVKALYRGCITQVDDQIGSMMETLDELGLADDTLIIFTSDHGEPLGDHGTIRKNGVPMWEELTRIPFILKGPSIPKDRTMECLIENTDVTPTILGLLDIEPGLPAELWEGRDLTPLIRGELDQVRDKAYMGYFTCKPYTPWVEGPLRFNTRAAIRTDRFKLIINNSRIPGFPIINELYDVEEDPFERHNLINEGKEVAEHLQNDLLRFVDISFHNNYCNRLLPRKAHYYRVDKY